MTAVQDLPTPALVVDTGAFEHNLAAMATALPGARCRPHVKAHKTTALAREQAALGHRTFTFAHRQWPNSRWTEENRSWR